MQLEQLSPITPEAFWTKFSMTLRSKWTEQVEECYSKSPEWTKFLTQLLKDMAKAFKFHVETESWPRIDVAYFDHAAADLGEWAREVAIEIENDSRTYMQEIFKLIEINAGLKVLITYSRDLVTIKNNFGRFKAVYDSRKYNTNPCNWLFVFGSCGGELEDFIAFKFDGKNLSEIIDDTKTGHS